MTTTNTPDTTTASAAGSGRKARRRVDEDGTLPADCLVPGLMETIKPGG